MLLILRGLRLSCYWTPDAPRPARFSSSFAAIVSAGVSRLILPKLVLWSARALRPIMNWAGGSEGALAVDAMIQTPRRCPRRPWAR